ncbi:MAG: hypothetical protein COB89_01755 [Piscirickettsiaceae bacterium]|nr:MAG: hypothetical protein COB89_07090 [Piscirickettsiaceae bacterium]PCH85667.1 MAG: hypothetical protein COB89_01755 [Piscirickettsiaceae bacterium]
MNQDELEPLVKQTLDERKKSLPGHIQSALAQARYSAITSARPSQSSPWWWGGIATAASITLAVVLWQPVLTTPSVDSVGFDDMELIAAEDDFEFYEDLEFIVWLNEMEQTG